LAAILVAIVAGAYWLKVRPTFALSGGGSQESTDALLARGVSLHAAEQYDAALELYHKVLQRDPANASAQYNIAQIYNGRGQFAQTQGERRHALEALAKATELNPRLKQ